MVRTSHALVAHGHALWQYVDDLLAWLDRISSPLWASLLVVLFLILGIPMSWHKAALDVEVDDRVADLSADLVDLNSSRQAFQNCAIIAQVDRLHTSTTQRHAIACGTPALAHIWMAFLAALAHSFVQGTTSHPHYYGGYGSSDVSAVLGCAVTTTHPD